MFLQRADTLQIDYERYFVIQKHRDEKGEKLNKNGKVYVSDVVAVIT